MASPTPSTLLEDSGSSLLRRQWTEERAYRIGRAVSWVSLIITSIAVILNLIFAGPIEVAADLILALGCGFSIYLTGRRRSQRYFVWWPLYMGFLVAIIPSTWFSGGIYSPWLGIYLAVLAIFGSVMQTRVSPYKNILWLFVYLAAWTAVSQLYPPENVGEYVGQFPPIFMALAMGLCLMAIGYCLNSLIRTERILSLETEQRYAELFQARAHLLREESANQAKSTFLANISHELRTPLGAVLGYAHLLQEKTTTPEEKILFAQTIERNGRQLARLVDDLLDLSKVEAGRIELERLDSHLGDLIGEVLNLLAIDAKKKQLTLSVRLLSPVPEVINTDPLRFKQILTNIVGNAIKFSERGEIEILLRLSELDLSTGEPQIFLTVRDAGRGIALSEREKLFKPFSQADASMTRRYGGTGLGLNFSRELARLLGGDLVLSWSQLGVGSEFTFYLPAHSPAGTAVVSRFAENGGVQTEIPASGPTVFDFSSLSILIVDDAPENRDIMKRFLAPTGARLDEAADGLECLQKIETRPFDLVLMDIQMPGLDGLQATAILRQKEFRLPIIAITAHAMKEDRERCLEAGCNDHLAKPLKKTELLQMIETYRSRSITPRYFSNEVSP